MKRLLLLLSLLLLAACQSNDVVTKPEKVGAIALQIADQDRGRTIATQVWYPVGEEVEASQWIPFYVSAPEAPSAPILEGKHPLIILSHGWTGEPYSEVWLAQLLAANGYIVAAPHHLDLIGASRKPTAEHWNRPLDVSAVIDALLESEWASHIDEERIGIAGFSLGGTTSLWVAGGESRNYDHFFPPEGYASHHVASDLDLRGMLDDVDFEKGKQSYRDPRVKAALLMAPAFGWIFESEGLSQVEIPCLIIAPESDEVVATEFNGCFFAENIETAEYHLISGKAGHCVFLSEFTEQGIERADPKGHKHYLYQDHETVDRQRVHEEVGVMAVHFFNEALSK